jgi:hypothetical protein
MAAIHYASQALFALSALIAIGVIVAAFVMPNEGEGL